MNLIDKLLYKYLGSKVTFSQCGEDVILDHIFRARGIENVSYLDIGTNHPVHASNTYFFYRKGGNGVCVEPNPSLCELIQSKRPKDTCLNLGITAQPQDPLDFYIMSPHTLSTFSKADAEALAKNPAYKITEVRKVPLEEYNKLVETYFPTPPHLVSIDVEGLNEEIVFSIDFSASRPLVFCVETTDYSETMISQKNQSIINRFAENGYLVYADTYLNTIFIDEKGFA